MLLQTILEGLGLGALLVLVCAVGIHKGAVGMAHLYDAKVQERCVALGLTTTYTTNFVFEQHRGQLFGAGGSSLGPVLMC